MIKITNYKLQITNSKGYNRKGFTLIEVVVTIAVFTLIAYGTLALISGLFSDSSQQSRLLSGGDQARKAAFKITNELRNAAVANTGAYSLAEASAQQLIFYSNLDGGTDIERIRYFVQNGALYKGVIKPSGTPLSYNPVNETVNVVQNDLGNGSSPVFYYYDDTYDGTVDNYLVQPVNINQVRLVKLVLRVINTGGKSGTNTYTVTAQAAIRNLKTNLGD